MKQTFLLLVLFFSFNSLAHTKCEPLSWECNEAIDSYKLSFSGNMKCGSSPFVGNMWYGQSHLSVIDKGLILKQEISWVGHLHSYTFESQETGALFKPIEIENLENAVLEIYDREFILECKFTK